MKGTEKRAAEPANELARVGSRTSIGTTQSSERCGTHAVSGDDALGDGMGWDWLSWRAG